MPIQLPTGTNQRYNYSTMLRMHYCCTVVEMCVHRTLAGHLVDNESLKAAVLNSYTVAIELM
jgi:hypothetical protein